MRSPSIHTYITHRPTRSLPSITTNIHPKWSTRNRLFHQTPRHLQQQSPNSINNNNNKQPLSKLFLNGGILGFGIGIGYFFAQKQKYEEEDRLKRGMKSVAWKGVFGEGTDSNNHTPVSHLSASHNTSSTTTSKEDNNQDHTSNPQSLFPTFAPAVKKAIGSVVGITVEIDIPSFFSKHVLFSCGSGFIIDPSGLVLTNAHVVADLEENHDGGRLKIKTSDGVEYVGQIFAIDHFSDLAVLKIITDPGMQILPKWRAVEFATTHQDLHPGDFVLAIGHPIGFQNTVTSGIISSLGRKNNEIGQKDSRLEYIQTDATVHVGSSGGPLINTKGECIGIITTRAEQEGLSFAIRSDKAMPLIEQLVEKGKIVRPWLGLRMFSLNKAVWSQIHDERIISAMPKVSRGVLITEVCSGSPASKAMMTPGMVILRVNGENVNSTQQLFKIIGFSVGDPLTMDVVQRENGVDVEKRVVVTPEELNVYVKDRMEFLS